MLLLASSVCGLFKWRQFEPEVILLAVGWYLRFSLSYRDVEELLAERGLSVDHVTVWRWVQRYAPELDRRLRKRLKATNDSWRVDETYVRVKGKWVYLYRAVDSTVRRSTSFLGQTRCSGGRALSDQSLGRGEPSRAAGHQHRQARCLSASHVELKAGRVLEEKLLIDRCSILITSWNRITGPSNAGCVQASIFAPSGEFGARSRLQSDSYDSQTPGVRECGGCEGRSTAPVHSRCSRRRTELPIIYADFRLDYKNCNLYRGPLLRDWRN